MRNLLITATLLVLAGATPALAQSYAHATSQYEERQDEGQAYDDGYDDRQPAPTWRGQTYDGRGARPGRDYGYGYADQGYYGAYGDREDRYRPARRRHHRRANAAVSRYTASGRPVHYNDGMIRTGRDFPAGTVGRNGY